ncbi:hypothetical protein CWE08_06105 [Aliidiomarina iranensis]|uniref:DUF4381 domain-containing protein n=1 Tax=Aliidiomarina iranensis TaxID=1434071 RepID=A0A432VWV6_9GAMM|nr:DUF4381 domain-containing protein [Aliidiomarina iranensis]RUO21160.1 hypothetical protein CWE08_06105 [Aliidiomarina iranensis]
MDALADLNDIVPAESAHWWPLPWGYWLLAFVVVAFVIGVTYLLYQRQQKQRIYLAALKELANKPMTLTELSSLAKRAALQVWPQSEVAHLAGADWHRFLIDSMPSHERNDFAKRIAPFAELIYQPASEAQITEYRALVTLWLRLGLPKRRPHV